MQRMRLLIAWKRYKLDIIFTDSRTNLLVIFPKNTLNSLWLELLNVIYSQKFNF